MTKWVLFLITANIAVYLLQGQFPEQTGAFAFVPGRFFMQPWTVITYMFLHADFGHIFFNMLSLYFFGPRVEERLGGVRFLTLYFVSGLFGAGTSMVFSPHSPIIGASAGVFGVLLAFARLWPRAQLLIWGIIPVEARTLVVIMTAVSLLGGVGLGFQNVAHFAHLGGFVGGWLVLRLTGTQPVDERRRVVQARRAPTPTSAATERWKQIQLERLHPVNREEAERVLSKLETRGPGSLTTDEQAFLDRFSGL